MPCATCVRRMVWNNSDVNQNYYTYNCTTLELESHVVGGGQFQSVCGCLENGAYSDSEDVYIENGGTGYINFEGILLYPCEETPEPSFTPSPFPTRTPNHTPTPTSTYIINQHKHQIRSTHQQPPTSTHQHQQNDE